MTLEAGREAIEPTIDDLEERNRHIDEQLGLLQYHTKQTLEFIEEAAGDAARAYNTSAPVYRELVQLRAEKRMSPELARHRASEAARVLSEPLFKEAMLLVERNLYDELLNVDPTTEGDELRRSLVDRIRAVREVLAALANMVDQVREPSRSSFA